jgi:hypothetical protein
MICKKKCLIAQMGVDYKTQILLLDKKAQEEYPNAKGE